MPYYFTSESVSRGHPDKICDQISDMLLDHFLSFDPVARCGIETAATTNKVLVFGEYRSSQVLDPVIVDKKIRTLIQEIGYEQEGFHWQTVEIEQRLHHQSADIALGVDECNDKPEGAGDQGIMFGFACTETDTYMPASLHYAHEILRNLQTVRTQSSHSIFGPDAKSQITLAYDDQGAPLYAHTIVLSTQHDANASLEDVKAAVMPIIKASLPPHWITDQTQIHINATGRFVVGGPDGDAGLTGRKIIVDTYGGAAPHGGGAFSGKDPTKVDRSAAYMARYLAKNIVAAGLCDRVTLQLSYCIGLAKPLSVYIKPEGEIRGDFNKIQHFIETELDLSPKGIRTYLALNRPIYLPTAAFGHFGRTPTAQGHFTWEKIDLIDHLSKF